jgi:hypothetical protein
MTEWEIDGSMFMIRKPSREKACGSRHDGGIGSEEAAVEKNIRAAEIDSKKLRGISGRSRGRNINKVIEQPSERRG